MIWNSKCIIVFPIYIFNIVLEQAQNLCIAAHFKLRHFVFKGKKGLNFCKLGQERGKMEPNSAKWAQIWSNGAKFGQMGPNRVQLGQTGSKW
jgi:hypothetical protein